MVLEISVHRTIKISSRTDLSSLHWYTSFPYWPSANAELSVFFTFRTIDTKILTKYNLNYNLLYIASKK